MILSRVPNFDSKILSCTFTNTQGESYTDEMIVHFSNIKEEATINGSNFMNKTIEEPSITTYTSPIKIYPNPSNSKVMLEFSLDKSYEISITVYDNLGRVIATPISNQF